MGIIMKKANRNKTLKLAFIGIMCALTTVVTWVLQIGRASCRERV